MRTVCKAEVGFPAKGRGPGVGRTEDSNVGRGSSFGGVVCAQEQRGGSPEAPLSLWQWREAISPHHGSAHGHKIWDDVGFSH